MRNNSSLWRWQTHLFDAAYRLSQNIDWLLLMVSVLLNIWFIFSQVVSLAIDQILLWF